MKLTVDYNVLKSALTYVGSVANSQSSLETNRIVVFEVTEDKLSLFGESATIGAITDIEKGNFTYETDNEEGKDIFQVKTKEFLAFLDTFTVDRTYPSLVEFELENNRLNLTVNEEPLEDQPSYLRNKSHWMFELTPMKKSTLDAMVISEGQDVINTELLGIYIDAMLPLLNNGDASMNDSRVNFEEKYVYVFTSRTFALYKNKLPDCMHGIVLGYAGVDLLKELCKSHDQIFVSKSEDSSKLYVSADNNRIAIKFNRKMPPYDTTLQALKHENYITIDRKMLASIIRRLKLVNDETLLEVDLSNEVLKIGNKKFNQAIPISEYGGAEIGDFKIRVNTKILEDSVIGDHSIYPDELTLTTTRIDSYYMVELSDVTKNWLSVFRVMAK